MLERKQRGEDDQELTWSAVVASACSGKLGRRRIDGDHRRRSRTKTMAWRRSRASRGAWLGGEEEGVGAELEGVSERLRNGCGRGSGVGGDELRSVAGGRGSRGG